MEVVAKANVRKHDGYLYFVDKQGDVSRAKMVRGRAKGRAKKGKQKSEKVCKVGVKKQAGYLYFVDKKGNVARAKMVRGGRKKKRR